MTILLSFNLLALFLGTRRTSSRAQKLQAEKTTKQQERLAKLVAARKQPVQSPVSTRSLVAEAANSQAYSSIVSDSSILSQYQSGTATQASVQAQSDLARRQSIHEAVFGAASSQAGNVMAKIGEGPGK